MSKALLLIDVQNDYFPGGKMELAGMAAASANAAEVLACYRAEKRPRIHVRHEFPDAAAPFFRPGSPGAEIHGSVTPAEGEPVILKHQVNAFHGTDLHSQLEALGIRELVIVGAMSHMCVEGTTRAAAELGYRCQVIHDACATREQQFQGRRVSAEDVHATAMSALAFAYADVIDMGRWRR